MAWSASDPAYADSIINFLDPNNEIFSARLYQQHCVESQFGFIKDLRVIGNRSLKRMVLIDNNCLSFALNINNGIPILPFYDNPKDEELKHLSYYLKCLTEAEVEDVRDHNKDAFGLLRILD